MTAIEGILDLARWAPSGDNTQPWRFEIAAPDHVVVHGFDTRSHCVYDLDGHSSHLALGGLLASMRIAASGRGLRTRIVRRANAPDTHPTFDVYFDPDATIRRDELLDCIETRRVQRRPMRMRALTPQEKATLEGSVGEGYDVRWLEGLKDRWRVATLLWFNAGLRLTLPEAYEVHSSIVEWNARFSEDRIPDQALGASALTLRLMRFALQSWSRVELLNRWLGGTIVPRIELDLIPGLACGAHFLIWARAPCVTVDDYVAAGAAMQRFWLKATALRLQVQPQMTPLIFARYAVEGRRFSKQAAAQAKAQEIARRLIALFGGEKAGRGVFMGRIGAGTPANARSLRRPLHSLLMHEARTANQAGRLVGRS